MISSNLKSMATTLTNGIAMFIPSVQESYPKFGLRTALKRMLSPATMNLNVGPRLADEFGDPNKFLQMVYLEIVTIH